MTIEATLESIDKSLKEIRDLLAGGAAPVTQDAETPAAEPADSDDGSKDSPKTEAPKSEKKTTAKSDEAPTKDDVRDALKTYQKRTNAAAARKLLADVGDAKTLTDLKEEKYQEVIDAANAES